MPNEDQAVTNGQAAAEIPPDMVLAPAEEAKSEDPKPENESVFDRAFPLAHIEVDHATQVRVAINPATVDDYHRIISGGQLMDAMVVFKLPDGRYLLADGWHRRVAYQRSDVKHVPVRIFTGTISDALEYAIRKNCGHGERMTNADKRRAVEIAVTDPKIGNYPDKKISLMCRVSESLVGQVRRGETPEVARAKRERRKSAKKKASGNRERAVTVHERHTENTPTQVEAVNERVKSIRDWIHSGKVSEEDVVVMFATETHRYRFLPKDGEKVQVRIKGKANRYRGFTAILEGSEDGRIDLTAGKGTKFEVEG